MAVATTTVLAVTAAASAAASLASGAMASKAAGKQAGATMKQQFINAELSKMDAARMERAANTRADLIRAAAIEMRGTQAAQQSTSGALVASGSTQYVVDQTTRKAEGDALAAVMEGIYQTTSKESEARYAVMAGKEAGAAGVRSANAAMLQGVAGAVQAGAGYYTNKGMLATKQG